MSAKSQRHDKEPRLAVLARARMASRSTLAVVDLLLGADFCLEAAANLRISWSNSACKTLDRVVRTVVRVMLDEILIDRRCITALSQSRFDEGGVFAAAAARTEHRRSHILSTVLRRKVGGHFAHGGVRF